jgi:hypothetical protein
MGIIFPSPKVVVRVLQVVVVQNLTMPGEWKGFVKEGSLGPQLLTYQR